MLHYLQTDTTSDPDPLGSFFTKVLPLPKLASDLVKSLSDITKVISSMDTEMTKVVKTMGVSTQQGLALKTNFNESFQEVVDLGGKLSDVTDQQAALLDVSGRNLISLKEQSAQLFAAVSVTGIKAEVLQKAFYDVGMETAHIAENVLTMVRVSNQLGVNAQAVAGTVTTNLDKLNRFGFTNGVEGLAKMAGKAQALRFDVTETFELADDLMSPERAIETAAAIQRLGGAATALNDPLKLMDLAQNDVGGLQDELGKLAKQYTYFDEKSKSFQIMPGARRQLKEVADALGIDRKEFEKMALETSKLEDKMSKIKFSGLDISKEDQEQLANLAQLKDIGGGKKEYVINYRDDKGQMQLAELASLNAKQLEQIKKQTDADAAEAGEDPQIQLINIAKDQLGEIGKLAAANEKIASTIPLTFAASKGGEATLKYATDASKTFADTVGVAFGPKSDFKLGMDEFGEDASQISGTLKGLLSGDLTKASNAIEGLTSTFFDTSKLFFTNLATQVVTGKIEPDKLLKDGFFTPKGESVTINDGFKTPKSVGDLINTPDGVIEPHPKDYMLFATELPKVLQLSSESGMRKVLSEEVMSKVNAAIFGRLNKTNTNETNTNPQKQEVVHTVNFKVSVETPKNKLSDMLVEELPKNPTLMQYIVKYFGNTKTSGGYTE
jgi:hypothetical protein